MKNKIDLSVFPTETLEELLKQIKRELKSRKSNSSVSKRILFINSLKTQDFLGVPETIRAISKFNSNNLLRLPGKPVHDPIHLCKYLPCLFNQDWSNIYPPTNKSPCYYVYAHVDPRKRVFVSFSETGGNYGGEPFYIGKGKEERAFDLKRNQGHGKIIREILSEGYQPEHIVKILFSDLDENKAFEIESKLIYFFGTQYSKIRKGYLVNLEEPAIPDFIGEMKKIPTRSQIEGCRLRRNRDDPSCSPYCATCT